VSTTNFEDAYALSPLQQGMLFHSVYAPESGTYVTQVSCRLGSIDPAAFEAAWQRAADRHAVLRTAFVWKKTEQPLQVVGRRVKLPIERMDWRELDGAAQERALRDLLAADRARGFEPSRAPLMRLTLARLGEESYQLLWSHHHLLLDGWSVPILLGEVFSFYEAFRAGREPEPPLPRPYGDYIRWLERLDLAAAEVFWQRLLAGFTEPTPLPFDRSTGAEAQPEECAVRMSWEATVRLQELARRARVTLNSIVHGAWAILLSRSCGQRDVVYGATVSGRPADLDGAETMVGLFINTLPVRLGVPPQASLLPWLLEVQARLAEMREHEHSPLARIQAWSDVPRGTQLFDSMIVFENYHVDESLGRGLAQTGLRIDDYRSVESTNYPLCLLAGPGAALTLRILYDGARFAAATIRRMLDHLEALLAGMAARPEACLDELPWLGGAERHQLLREWNTVPPPPPEERCIHELFAAAVERAPDATALWSGGAGLSFREVERRANRLARHLRRFGVGADVPVGLCAERSPEMIVSLLAILKAGGAFLPLDPEHPAERLAAMLEDARPAVIVTQDALAGALPPGFRLVRLDADGPAIAAESADPPGVRIDDRNLAYVLFTSGSTGRPKGVMIDHRGLRNRLLWQQTAVPLRPVDRVVQKTPFSFDVSVWEIFGPLLAGSCLVIARPGGHRDSQYLADLIAEQEVTLAHFVPSMLQVFLDEPRAGTCASLERVLCSGEAVSVQLQERFFRRFDAALHNLYGPTEASIEVSWWPCERGDTRSTVPMGRPISNLRLHLLDADFRPVPIGIASELCIGGIGLARGYVHRPDLTAERFVPDPVGEEPGERLYRTGDLVRYLADGCIEYLGRLDQQVKVRGFRIELAEIEGALLGHSAVREAAVVARDLGPGDRRLVAYVASGPPEVAETELRQHLWRTLPEYMVPSLFVFLESLPLLANGKLDRRALPAPDRSRSGREGERLEARTEAEGTLAGIWQEVLNLDHVGVTDNFFELGGDSILCLQIVSRAHRKGLGLTPRLVFENPTIAGLVEVLDCAPPLEAEQGLVTGPVPLTPVQHWFFAQELAAPHHFNQAVLLEAVEPLDAGLLCRVVERLTIHHDALRMRFQRDAAGWHQVNAGPGSPAPVVHLDLASLGPVRFPRAVEAAAEQLQKSLDLARGPLLRVALMTSGPAVPARLLILVHHLVVDGVSWRVLLEDLQEVYSGLRRGEEPSLPAKSTSFRSWAHRLRDYAAGEEVTRDLDFWVGRRRAEVQPLPVDHAEGEDVQGAARTVTAALDPAETQALLQEVPRAYQTQINDVLLTALALALAGWTGERRFLVDVEGHGREEILAGVDLSRTVGWFTTLTPVLLDVTGVTGDPAAALRAVKEQLRRVPARGIGYGALRWLSPRAEVRERLGQLPGPELVFNYLGQLDAALAAQASLFRLAREGSGSLVDGQGARPHRLQVSGQVIHKQLQLVVVYGGKRYDAATAEALIARFAAALRALIASCPAQESGGYTPADFPDVDLSQEALDGLLAEIEEIDALEEGSAA
jgi:amino acid adenylation domain-containing protein/non-ribosomal peptide synthase protein (TIGR01720 family)